MPLFTQLIFILCIFFPFAVFIYCKVEAVSKIILWGGFYFSFRHIFFSLLSTLSLGQYANLTAKLVTAANPERLMGYCSEPGLFHWGLSTVMCEPCGHWAVTAPISHHLGTGITQPSDFWCEVAGAKRALLQYDRCPCKKTHRQIQRRWPCGNGGRGWIATASSHEPPKVARKPPEASKSQGRIPPTQDFRDSMALPPSWFQTLDSRTRR